MESRKRFEIFIIGIALTACGAAYLLLLSMSTREKYLSLAFAMILTVAGWGQDAKDSKSTHQFGASVKALHDLTSMSPAYRNEALGLVVAEANRIAEALKLPENSKPELFVHWRETLEKGAFGNEIT